MKGILISGPTGAGKSDLALSLAKRLGGELISCDSVQVYKGLEIGANKMRQTDGIEQHLIDVLDWNEPGSGERKINFTVGDFMRTCFRCIDDVCGRGKVPILVGGTGLYMDWLLHGKPGAPSTDDSSMSVINSFLEGKNWDEALEELEKVDASYAKTLACNDWYRLRRALCVHHQCGGRPLSSFPRRVGPSLLGKPGADWRCIYLGWKGDRALQFKALDLRCEEMILRGLLKEVQDLRKDGFDSSWQAGRAIGYKESLDFFDRCENQNCDQIESLRLLVADFQAQTRQYTRKQEKWFISQKPSFKFLLREQLRVGTDGDDGDGSFVDAKNSLDLVEKALRLYEMDVESYSSSSSFASLKDVDPLIMEMEENRNSLRIPGAKDTLRKYRSPKGPLTSSEEVMQDLLKEIFKNSI